MLRYPKLKQCHMLVRYIMFGNIAKCVLHLTLFVYVHYICNSLSYQRTYNNNNNNNNSKYFYSRECLLYVDI